MCVFFFFFFLNNSMQQSYSYNLTKTSFRVKENHIFTPNIKFLWNPWIIYAWDQLCSLLLPQKRFYNRETLRGIRMSRLAEIPPLYHNCLRSLDQKRVNYLSSIEAKGVMKDICWITQNYAAFVSLV